MSELNKIFDVNKSIAAQEKLCMEKGYPHFAPMNGVCWWCHRNIYNPVEHERKTLTPYITGIDVEKAGRKLVTGCPHCNRSYCD
jgi:hypothetical protein